MKKFFEMMGVLTLLLFSFFAKDKVTRVVKEEDEIMIQIKKHYKEFNSKGENASINHNTIIPGISSRKVNINKSYQNMRQYGKYSDELYIYDYIKPKVSIDKNKDKIIESGNKKYRNVSLIVQLNDNSNINNILKIANDNDIKINFFITDDWLINHNNLVLSLIKNGHSIGISSKMNYNSKSVKWMDTIIKKVGKQNTNYCLYKKNNNCSKIDSYTIKPIYIKNNYLLNIQDKISNGNMFMFDNNNSFNEELLSIIRYISSRGYNIVALNEIVRE